MKFLFLFLIPVCVFAANNILTVPGDIDPGFWRKIDPMPDITIHAKQNDTSTQIISIDKNTVKIERTYTVKDTIIYKR